MCCLCLEKVHAGLHLVGRVLCVCVCVCVCVCLCFVKDRFHFTGKHLVAVEESNTLGHPTIRHNECEMLLVTSSKRCQKCEVHRKSLFSLLSRKESRRDTDSCAPDSHVNYRFLSTPEKITRLQRLHSLQRSTKQQLERLKQKLARAIESDGVVVADSMSHDLQEIMEENTSTVANAFPENSFERLFWEQQQWAQHLKDARLMRWHPLIIKWCLYRLC